MDERTPVVIGAGQHTVTDRAAHATPLALITAAARQALADTGAEAALRPMITSVGLTDCFSWRESDPAALAAELGLRPHGAVTTYASGTSPLDLLADACQRIQAGELDAALLAGGEAGKSLYDGRYVDQPTGAGPAADRVLGIQREPSHEAESAAGLHLPVHYYPLFEHAVRAAAGRDLAAHEKWLGRLWTRFAEVAAANPYAWTTGVPDIAAAGPGNRLVGHPYRKLMTANIQVDQAAAVVVCSVAAARAAGVPETHWAVVRATGAAHDHWHVGERDELHRSPAIRAIGEAVLRHAGVGIGDVAYLDLYSCFPSAVQVAATELGVDLAARVPTLTGGLTFAGGPGSNYVMHALATLVERLRRDPEATGLVTAVGWYLTKHAAAVLSGSGAGGYAHHDVQSTVDAQPRREIASGFVGDATVESYTATYDPEGSPFAGHVSCRLDDGRRAFAASYHPQVISRLVDRDPIGARVSLQDADFAFL